MSRARRLPSDDKVKDVRDQKACEPLRNIRCKKGGGAIMLRNATLYIYHRLLYMQRLINTLNFLTLPRSIGAQ